MRRSNTDLLVAILLSLWWVLGLITFDWQHLAMSSLGLWLLWRAREAEGMLLGRSRRRAPVSRPEDGGLPWPLGDGPM